MNPIRGRVVPVAWLARRPARAGGEPRRGLSRPRRALRDAVRIGRRRRWSRWRRAWRSSRRPAHRASNLPSTRTCAKTSKRAAATRWTFAWTPRSPGLASTEADWVATAGTSCRAASRLGPRWRGCWSSEVDLLMLDEPTNHLDVAAIEWLEKTLATRPGALVVASHDRAFLDAVVERIWELRDRRLEAFRGNYCAYLGQREERDARARKDADTRAERHRARARARPALPQPSQVLQDARARAPARGARGPGCCRAAARRKGPRGWRSTATAALGPGSFGRRGDRHRGPGVSAFRACRSSRSVGWRRGVAIGSASSVPTARARRRLLRTIAGDLAPLDGFLRLGTAVQVGYLAQIRARAACRRDGDRRVHGRHRSRLGTGAQLPGPLPVQRRRRVQARREALRRRAVAPRAGASSASRRPTCCCSTSPRTTSTSRRARHSRRSCARRRRR